MTLLAWEKMHLGHTSNNRGATRLDPADDTQLFLSFPFQVHIAPRLADISVNVKASLNA